MGRKSKAEERKPEILTQAYKAAKEYGIQGLTLGKIARNMGVAPSLLSHYFPSKQDIVLGLIDFMVDIYDESLMLDFTDIKNTTDRFAALMDARLWEFSRQVVDDAVWYEVFALAQRDGEIRNRLCKLYHRDKEALNRELATILPEVDSGAIEELAGTVIAMMEGIGYFALVSENDELVSKTADAMKAMALTQFENLRQSTESAGRQAEKTAGENNKRRRKR